MSNVKFQMSNGCSNYLNNKFIHWIFVILSLVITAAGGLGCARTVTQIVTYGDQMAVEVELRGTMEVNANRYFLVLAARLIRRNSKRTAAKSPSLP